MNTHRLPRYLRPVPLLATVALLACQEGDSLTSPGPKDEGTGTGTVAAAAYVGEIVATYTVVNTSDAGPGSLRQAILDANSNPGRDLINFAIPGGGPHTIQPLTLLPGITDPVVIDGYTQPGAIPNTNGPGLGLNTVLMIELDGSLAGASADGLGLGAGASNSLVRGLAINRFQGTGGGGRGRGIAINDSPVAPSGIRVEGNFIGTDVTGTTAQNNGASGVALSLGAFDNTIGGTDPAARNLISGNGREGTPDPNRAGVKIGRGASSNIVQGNLIGTDITGTEAIGNRNGLRLDGSGRAITDNLIGGSTAAARNVISGNVDGIALNGAGTSTIEGNYVGTDPAGTGSVPNTKDGIILSTVNGTAIFRNTVRNNGRNGIDLGGSFNEISGNVVADNGGQEILLRPGANSNLLTDNTAGLFVNGNANTITSNSASGLRVDGDDNRVEANAVGPFNLTIAGGSRNIVRGNDIAVDVPGVVTIGIAISGIPSINKAATDNLIEMNSVQGASYGIRLDGGFGAVPPPTSPPFITFGNRILDNEVTGNGIGIQLFQTHDNELTGNVVDGNTTGIRLEFAETNRVVENVSRDNGGYGILLTATSTGNRLEENVFLYNGTVDVQDDDANSGDLNVCQTVVNWVDDSVLAAGGSSGCTFVATLPAVIDRLESIAAADPNAPFATKLGDAIAKAEVALVELEKTPPDKQAAVGNIEGVVGDLEAAVQDGLDPVQAAELMDGFAAIARQLAVDAIEEAIARGGDSGKIAVAQNALAEGDALRASGAFKAAVNKYKDALANAEGA